MRDARPDERAPDPAPLESVFPTIPPRAPSNDAAPKRPPLRLAHALAFVAASVAVMPWCLAAGAIILGLAASPQTYAAGGAGSETGPLGRSLLELFEIRVVYVGSALAGLALGTISRALVGASSDEASKAARFAVRSSRAALASGVVAVGAVVLLTFVSLLLAR